MNEMNGRALVADRTPRAHTLTHVTCGQLSFYVFLFTAEPFPISNDGETPFCTRGCLRNATNEKSLSVLKLSGWSGVSVP
jgi:hypothetical protein